LPGTRNAAIRRATRTIERLCHFFGKGGLRHHQFCSIPDVIVVGGGVVGNIGDLYTTGLAELGQFIFNNRVRGTPFKTPPWETAPVFFGAAALVA